MVHGHPAAHNVVVEVQNYGDAAYGWAMEDTTGVCKTIADRKTEELLGAHYMGPRASTPIPFSAPDPRSRKSAAQPQVICSSLIGSCTREPPCRWNRCSLR